jgi:serine/threonine-protein kinase
VSLSIGHVINGKYRVVRLLGDGGMGSVYEAVHVGLGSRVALKSLHPELANGGLGPRFLQEARAAARIQSPHVVRVADVDQTESGLPFMVLEYLEGRTLQTAYEDMYREGRRLGYGDALDYAMQLFEGVEAAHQAGVVHRDLKPDNVMLTITSKGATLLKLLDFGIAKLDGTPEGRPVLTRPGVILGTPQYMAPEQVYSAGGTDARADVFSLGVMLFEMLAGRRPVGGDEPQQIAIAYLTGEIARLRDLAPEIAPDLADAVHRAMMANPPDRFPTVQAFREAVEPFALAVRPPSTSAVFSAPNPALLSNPAGAARGIPGTWSHDEPAPVMAPPGPGAPPAAPRPPAPETTAMSLAGSGASQQGAAFASTDLAPSAAAALGPPMLEPTRRSSPHAGTLAEAPIHVSVIDAPPAPFAPAPSGGEWAYGAPPPAMPQLPLQAIETPLPPVSVQQWPYGPTSMAATTAPPRRQRGNPLVVVLIILLILAVAGGVTAAIYFAGFDSSQTKPTPRKPHKTPRPPQKLPPPSLR